MTVVAKRQRRKTSRTTARARNVTTLPPDPARYPQPVDRLLLDGRAADIVLGSRLTGGTLERTIEGASTLTLEVWDGDGAILKSGTLGQRVFSKLATVQLDGLTYSINGLSKSGDQLSLTAEDAVITTAKRDGRTKPLRASRASTTRAAFVAKMFRDARIPVLVLDEFVKQPIVGDKALKTAIKKVKLEDTHKEEKGRSKSKGVSATGLTVKGHAATPEQRRVMGAVMRAAGEVEQTTPRALLALVEAIIIECEFKNVQGSGADAISFGVLQNIPGRSVGLKGTMTKQQALDIAYSVKSALRPPGPTSKGGIIKLAREHPDWTPGKVAAVAINGGGDPAYATKCDGRKAEAEKIISAAGGEQLSTTSTTIRQYAFERKKGESTWTAARRLIDEVKWRLFVREGVVIIASEPALMRAAASVTLDRDAGFDPDFDWHRALRVGEMTGNVDAARNVLDPGEVAQVDALPQSDGRWLIATVSQDIIVPEQPAVVTLRRPQPPAKEPDPEVSTSTASGSLRERIVKVAESSLTTKTGFKRYSKAGALTGDLTPKTARSDCSQWVRAVYLKAGAQDPGTTTVVQAERGKRTTKPKPGDLMLTANKGHVELYVGGGRTIGHGSPPIDYADVSNFPGHFFVTFSFLD